MPSISVDYDEGEVRALIAADFQKRFGTQPGDEEISPSDPWGHWRVTVSRGALNADCAGDVREDA